MHARVQAAGGRVEPMELARTSLRERYGVKQQIRVETVSQQINTGVRTHSVTKQLQNRLDNKLVSLTGSKAATPRISGSGCPTPAELTGEERELFANGRIIT